MPRRVSYSKRESRGENCVLNTSILRLKRVFVSLQKPTVGWDWFLVATLLLTLQISCWKLHVRCGDSHKVFENRVRMKHFQKMNAPSCVVMKTGVSWKKLRFKHVYFALKTYFCKLTKTHGRLGLVSSFIM